MRSRSSVPWSNRNETPLRVLWACLPSQAILSYCMVLRRQRCRRNRTLRQDTQIVVADNRPGTEALKQIHALTRVGAVTDHHDVLKPRFQLDIPSPVDPQGPIRTYRPGHVGRTQRGRRIAGNNGLSVHAPARSPAGSRRTELATSAGRGGAWAPALPEDARDSIDSGGRCV
jgi:hypothetical protein